ncbi:hypothetical protein [Niallia endozanthoxylica]|uniref:Uncharacterized protein n=1 Tax=Niallia endozanthoxylica TaxID=2036016 RepID=A0A5J5HNV2_9BACI|nr:hypothetical protein [Niallia endozanthoxylica]KAA9022059.1 hypothetical protein F4V44_16235 [Niallia endozanthoxylica]
MRVNHQSIRQHAAISDAPLELKKGEVVRASIKEMLSDTDVILQIRGKEVRARFNEGVPLSGKAVTIQVNGEADGMLQAKTIATENTRTPSVEEKIFASAGLTGKETAGVKQAVRILLDKGLSLSKETIQELDSFIAKAQGTLEEKIDSVRALANKRLDATGTQLRAVHEALHGKPLNEVLTDIAKEIDPEFKLEKKDARQPTPNTRVQNENAATQKATIPAATKQEISHAPQSIQKENNPAPTSQNGTAVKENVTKSADTNTQAINPASDKQRTAAKQVAELSQTIRKNLEHVQNEPDLQKAVAIVKKEIVNHPKLDRGLAQKIDKAAQEAVKLQSIGKERLVEALKTAEAQLTKIQQATSQRNVPVQEPTNLTSQDGKLSDLVKNINQEVSKSPNLKGSIENVQETIVNNVRFPDVLKDKVNRAVNEAASLEKQGRITTGKELLSSVLTEVEASVIQTERKVLEQAAVASRPQQEGRMANSSPSEMVREVKAEVQKEYNLQRAVEKVRDQIISNPKVDREVAQKVEQAVKEAVQLQQIGRESTSRERLQQALAKAEVELQEIEVSQPKQPVLKSEPSPSETVKQVKTEVQSEPNLQRAVEKVREQIIANPKINREVAQKVEQAVKEAVQLQQIGRESTGRERLQQALAKAEVELQQIEASQTKQSVSKIETSPSETVKQVKTEVQSEPNLQKAVEKVREQIIANPKVDREVVQKVEQAVKEAVQLQQLGRETTGRERLQQALAKAEVELQQIEANQPKQPALKAEPSPSETVKQVKTEVQNEPNLQSAVEKVREQIIANPKVDREVVQKVEQAVKGAVQLQQIGRESTGRERLQQALAKAEVELQEIEASQPKQPALKAETNPSETVKQVKTEVQNESNLQRAVEKVREQIIANPKVDREVAQKIEQAVKEAVQLQQIGRESTGRERLQQALAKAEVELQEIEASQPKQSVLKPESSPSETVKQVENGVQNEPNLQRVVEKVREQIIANPKIDREVAQKVEQAVKEAVQLQQIGRESTGRERLQQALAKAEVDLQQIEASQPKQPAHKTEPSPSETVKQVKTEVQNEPNLQKAVEKVREQVITNPKVNREIAKKVEQSVKEAVQLQQIGRESTGRERLQQALAKAEVELQEIEASQPKQSALKTEPSPSETVKQVKTEVQNESNLQRAVEKVREQVITNPKVDREVAQKVEQAVKEAVQLQQIGRESIGRERLQQALAKAEVELQEIEVSQPKQPAQKTETNSSETVKQVKTEVQNEPNLQRAVEKVREQVITNPKVNREVAQKVEQAVKEAVQLQQIGRESTGRERLQQALAKAEVELQEIEASQPKQLAQTDVSRETRPSENVKEVKVEIQKERNLQRAVEKVQEQVIANPKVDREVAQKLEQAIKVTLQLARMGREAIGRGHLQTALTQAENELQQLETSKPVQTAQDSRPAQNIAPSSEQDQTNEASQIREAVKNVREQIQAEPDTRKAVQKVQELVSNNKNINPEIKQNLERFAGQANQLNQAGRDRLVKTLQQAEAELQQSVEAKGPPARSNAAHMEQPDVNTTQKATETNTQVTEMKTAAKTETQTLPSQSIRQALTQLQKEPNLELGLEQVRKAISSNPSIDLKTIEKIENALNHTEQLNDKGREIAARQHMTKELSAVEKELVETEPKAVQEAKPQETLPYDLNEQLQALNVQGKDILITKVTQKLAQATHDFRELKREISRNLDNVERVINTFKKNAYPQAKQMLEATISKLDNAILKSDMMLFTDMRTEKQLLQASSQLAEAKKLLSKGDHAQAGKIVHDVKTLIDKIIYKPSEQKVVHFVDKEVLGMETRTPSQQLLSKFSESTYNANQNHEGSARQMYDMVRSLGLNHESDVANSLVFQRSDQPGSEQQQQHQNLKEVLMKLAQGEGQENNPKIAQQAEQALTNLTGQQLLSKSDGNGTLQSMFFNLPLMLGGNPENLQVFINSKNEGEQVEWENCNLYFLLETKKLGDVGILLNSTDKNLSITVKNDMPGFKEKMEPIAELTKQKLQEVGYNVSSIAFTRMNPVTKQTTSHKELGSEMVQVKATRQNFNEKGLNFTI